MPHCYFVHYTAITPHGTCSRSDSVSLDEPLAYADDVDALAAYLRRVRGYPGVEIHSWQPLQGIERPEAAAAPSDGFILPTCQVEGDDLVIRFNIDSLCHSVTMGDSWPVQGDGQSAATIVDRAQFLVELSGELLREDEQGATPLHRLFDEAALEVIEQGGESIELHEDEDEE